MRNSFEALKAELLKSPVLAYPRFNSDEPFILDTDWSGEANTISAALSQEQDGRERVIMYGAKKLHSSQANYGATKGEMVAIFYFVRQWKYYLQFRPFIVRTDHQPLVHLRTMEPPDAVCRRWLETLANCNFTVIYRPGKKHGNADALSHAPHVANSTNSEEPVGTDEEGAVASLQEGDSPRSPLGGRLPLPELQDNDDVLAKVKEWIGQGRKSSGFPPLERRSMGRDELEYLAHLDQELQIDESGILRRRMPDNVDPSPVADERWLPCLPEDLWQEACRRAHHNVGHQGLDKTLHLLATTVYFPHQRRETDATIRECIPCQLKKRKEKDQRGTLMSAPTGYPFQRVSVDFVGPMNPSKRGHRYLLTMQDTFSK